MTILLCLQLLFVYCVPTNQLLTYRVEKVTVGLIQQVLQQETGIPIQEQELLVASGISPAANDPASKYSSDLVSEILL